MNKALFFVFFLLSFQALAQSIEHDEISKIRHEYMEYKKQYSHTIETKNTNLHYLKWGDTPSHQTILWLHGSYNNAFEIEPFTTQLNLSKYNVIAVDYYGHGQTMIPSGAFSTQSLFDDINNLLDSLEIKKCIIGGFSRGAYLATMFYKKNPHRVSALILEDGGISPFLEHFRTLPSATLKAKLDNEIQKRPQELFEEYHTEEEAFQALYPYGESTANNWYKNFSYIIYLNGKYRIYKDLDKIYGMDSYENLSDLTQGILTSNPFANDLMVFPFFEVISAIDIPTLILEASSDNDLFLNSNYYLDLKKQNKYIQHHTFENSDHNIHFDQPKEFIQSIIGFLQSNF